MENNEKKIDLLPKHDALILDSAINPDVAAARGYRSITSRSELERLGFTKPQRIVPCLLVPIYNVHGEIATYQIRPDQPRIGKKGKSVKYETPKDSRMVLDVPPAARPWLREPNRPLFVTEGARKADAAVSKGICCIALLGVWNWRGRNADGGRTALADWESITLRDRDVYIAFDSDAFSKPEVRAALARLREFLESRGAHVKVIQIPPGDAGTKVGLDDYLSVGHDVADLLALVTDQRLLPNTAPGDSQTYEATEQGLVYHKEVQGGTVPVQLTNFTARIVTEVSTDDGVEAELSFEIDTTLTGVDTRFTIPARQFYGMNWVGEKLGASAILLPGMSIRDHARAAIQLLSNDISKRRVYSHLGWREIDGRNLYLHAGGAIGPDGPVDAVHVALPDPLINYRLPSPPKGEDLRGAVRASLNVLTVAVGRVTYPIQGAIYRSVLGNANFSEHVVGPTGEGKTALCVVELQHYGADHSPDSLPASWSSTANALESLAFHAKDSTLLVDDFVPKGGVTDVQRSHREADRLLRGQGNKSGRQRLRPDASMRPAKAPRGLIISTGEEIPRGQSLRARVLIVEISPGDMDWTKLTVAQQDGAAGLLAQALSGFVQWLARRIGTIRTTLRSEVRKLRDEAFKSGQHRRTAFIVADLAVGFRYFLAFAREAEAIEEDEARSLWKACWAALVEVSRAQERHVGAEEPTRRFIDLLVAAITSGAAHIAGIHGEPPKDPEVWGWRQVETPDGFAWRFHGSRIGWVDGADLYLEPEASYAAAQKQAREGGDGLPVSSTTLHRRLKEKKYLLSVDSKRETLKVRRVLEGARREVLHLRAASIINGKPDQPDQSGPDKGEDAGSWSDPWSGSWSGTTPPPDHEQGKTRPHDGETSSDPTAEPPSGRVGRVSEEIDTRREGEIDHTQEVFKL